MTYDWTPTALGKMHGGTAQIIQSFYNDYLARQPWAANQWPGSGWRTGSNEHVSGRAMDGIITRRTGMRPTPEEFDSGMRAVNKLIEHGDRLGLQWVLFSIDGVTTWSYNMDRKSWKRLAQRGSISANHIDHWHAYFKPSALLPANFSWGGATEGAPSAPALPSTGVSKTIGDMASEVIAGKHGNGHANRQRSLGISAGEYAQVREEVNRRTGHGTNNTPTVRKTINQMAIEVIAGKHGTGHVARKSSLGVNDAVYAQVRAEVNRRTGSLSSRRYRVTTRGARLRGRAGPGTKYRQTMTAANGYVLTIVEQRNGWGLSSGGHWYSMQYLQRV